MKNVPDDNDVVELSL